MFYLQLINWPLLNFWYLWLGKLCLDISKKDRNSPTLLSQIELRSPSKPIFSEIVAIYCRISIDRQHQLVYSINLLKQVRFITRKQYLSLATRFMLSSLEPITCIPFSRESVPKFGTLFLIRLKCVFS